MIYVLDACAMLAYLRGEPGAEVVDGLLGTPGATCMAHAINLCEVYYNLLRQAGPVLADQAICDLGAAGIEECGDFDPPFWRSVGGIKSSGRISVADSFCLALAKRVNGEVVTSDRHEFEAWVPRRLCPIIFIR